ncbi:MAG TPA: metalloregulator ArsR/SmtB family transcription factor [Syntrophorhabdaceae bacterium]|jgi:ArsR family transcriptional regulator
MENTVQLYKALSEEMRLRILMLLTHGELCVCDLMAIFEEPQSKISRHLAYLKHSGLVSSARKGTWMHYSIKESLDELARAHLDFMRSHLSGMNWAGADAKKMEEVKARKLCETGSAGHGRKGG